MKEQKTFFNAVVSIMPIRAVDVLCHSLNTVYGENEFDFENQGLPKGTHLATLRRFKFIH